MKRKDNKYQIIEDKSINIHRRKNRGYNSKIKQQENRVPFNTTPTTSSTTVQSFKQTGSIITDNEYEVTSETYEKNES